MIRFALLLSASLLWLSGHAQRSKCTADLETVSGQVGKTVVFCGTPTEVHASRKPGGPIHLNFGGHYPDEVFDVVIFADVAGDASEGLVKRITGKEVQVKGLVKIYKDKPEIVLKRMDDLVVQ